MKKEFLFANRSVLFSFALIFGVLCGSSYATLPNEATLTLGNTYKRDVLGVATPPYFYATLDAAGYSDAVYYGLSERHNYYMHELLSGEWAAAVYYDGIDTEPIDPNDPNMGNKAM